AGWPRLTLSTGAPASGGKCRHGERGTRMLQPALRLPHYGGVRSGGCSGLRAARRSRSKSVRVTRNRLTWMRRPAVGAALIVAAITPGTAAGWSSSPCQRDGCESAGTLRWIRPLPGSWAVQGGAVGTTPGTGQAYAALGSQVAAVGSGLTVSAYEAST